MNSTRAIFKGLRLAKIHLVLAAVVVVMVLALPTTVANASRDTPGPGATDSQMPPPQEGNELEGDSELPWLFAVFIVTWAAFFGYAFIMSRRQREMRREIETLRLALLETEREGPTDGPVSNPSVD
jgi:CcmD family protein